jgi:nitrite reductase (NO-forming)
MWNKLRDWYLALVGIIVIAGGLYIASHTGSTDGTVNEQSKQTAPVASSTEAAKAPSAPDQPSPQTPPAAQAPSTTKVPSAPAASNAPPPAAENDMPAIHNHAAANSPQTNMAQAPAAPAPAPASQPATNVGATPAAITGGDPAAGKLVFRKCQVCHSLEPGKDVLGPSLANFWSQVWCGTQLRLFAGDEERESHLGREDTGCLSR